METKTLWAQLERVLDPELDESIVRLGFVQRVEQEGQRVRVVLRLPTYWCSPNFAYLMADGVRRALLERSEISQVEIVLEDHFASDVLSRGVSAGRSFCELFPDEATEDLEELRQRFLLKGYLSRLLVLVQALRNAGASESVLTRATLATLVSKGEDAWLCAEDSRYGPVRARLVDRYLARRAELGLSMDADAPLLLRPDGRAIAEGELADELRRLRATVVNLRASTALCEALLESRQQWWVRERKEAVP